MKIIRLSSGLGNQMYQYALFLKLSQNSKHIYLYSDKNLLKEHNGLELNKIFNQISIINKKSICLYFVFLPFFDRLFYAFNLLGLSKIATRIKFVDVITFPMWESYVFEADYFRVIDNVFSFPPLDDSINLRYLKMISETNSVSIHIRRGDYISSKHYRRTHGNICTIDYYSQAITYIENHVDSPIFFIFSDDIEWVKLNLRFFNAYYINHNIGQNSYKDMQLMSLCKHNIIANSTFSSWGAILNKNESKIVLAPSKWINDINDKISQKLVYMNWILVDNNFPLVTLYVDNYDLNSDDVNNIINQTHTDFCVVYYIDNHDKRFVRLNQYKQKSLIEIYLNSDNISFLSDNRWLEKEINRFYEDRNE